MILNVILLYNFNENKSRKDKIMKENIVSCLPPAVKEYIDRFDFEEEISERLPKADSKIAQIARQEFEHQRGYISRWTNGFFGYQPRSTNDAKNKLYGSASEDDVIESFARGADINAISYPYESKFCGITFITKGAPHHPMDIAAEKGFHKLMLYLYLLGYDPSYRDSTEDLPPLLNNATTVKTAKLLRSMGALAAPPLKPTNWFSPLKFAEIRLRAGGGKFGEMKEIIGFIKTWSE